MSNLNGDSVKTETIFFDLVIKNPCIDPDKIEIVKPVQMPPYYSYALYENQPDGMQINSVSLLQIKPEICMIGLNY